MQTLPVVSINPSTLPLVAKVIGFVVSWAASIYFLWVRRSPEVLKGHPFFQQVQRLSIVLTSIFLALIFGYLANIQGLNVLAWLTVVPTVLGITIFFWTAHQLTRPGPPKERVHVASISVLVAFLLYTSMISCGLTSAGVFLTVILTNPANAATGAGLVKPELYLAKIQVTGESDIQENREIPFLVSAGQINFGCEESRPQQARFSLPPGAVLLEQPTASWTNVSNAKTWTQNASIAGNLVLAQGTIFGLDGQAIFGIKNCPGGGHGELVLSGKYRSTTSHTEPKEIALTSSISSDAKDPVWVSLPTPQEFRIRSVNVTIQSTSDPSVLLKVTVTPSAPRAETEDRKFQVVLEPTRLGLSPKS